MTTDTSNAQADRRVAIVACMDGRFDPVEALGLGEHQVWVIRNAGGVITDDVIRSLVVSQRMLGATEIVLMHHTDCGMAKFRDAELARAIERDTGVAPPFRFQTFTDPEASVRQSMARLRESPFVRQDGSIRGYIYEIERGAAREVSATAPGSQTLS